MIFGWNFITLSLKKTIYYHSEHYSIDFSLIIFTYCFQFWSVGYSLMRIIIHMIITGPKDLQEITGWTLLFVEIDWSTHITIVFRVFVQHFPSWISDFSKDFPEKSGISLNSNTFLQTHDSITFDYFFFSSLFVARNAIRAIPSFRLDAFVGNRWRVRTTTSAARWKRFDAREPRLERRRNRRPGGAFSAVSRKYRSTNKALE